MLKVVMTQTVSFIYSRKLGFDGSVHTTISTESLDSCNAGVIHFWLEACGICFHEGTTVYQKG